MLERFRGYEGHYRIMLFWHEKNVSFCSRIYVKYAYNKLVLIDFLCRHLISYNLTEDAVLFLLFKRLLLFRCEFHFIGYLLISQLLLIIMKRTSALPDGLE